MALSVSRTGSSVSKSLLIEFRSIPVLTGKYMKNIVFAAFMVLAASLFPGGGARAAGPEDTLYLDLKDGRVVIELYPEIAPKHVERIKTLARSGFYNGVVFHRVIDGFMAQTGDPTGTGMGGSDLPDLKAEFTKTRHVRGTLSMARSSDPDSANSQFFICFTAAPFLDGQYTAFGRVTSGMEFVDAIKRGDEANNGQVTDPDKIVRMQVAADVKE
jgi:peptidylprolyl isomerase